MNSPPPVTHVTTTRKIAYRTRGKGNGGPIVRLMSPTDLGQVIKPFVFLDLFEVSREFMMQAMANLPLHPHSGIATITVPVEGGYRYHDPISGASGTINYGGLEWMRAGNGIWHGKELSASDAPRTQGFQLWLALPPNSKTASRTAASSKPSKRPRLARHASSLACTKAHKAQCPRRRALTACSSPCVPANAGRISRLPGIPSAGWHSPRASLKSARLSVLASLVVFEPGETPITLEASGSLDSVFLLASAVPHPHDLHLGNYSVHTSAQALEKGQRRIAEPGATDGGSWQSEHAIGDNPCFPLKWHFSYAQHLSQ